MELHTVNSSVQSDIMQVAYEDTPAHEAASSGDYVELEKLIKKNPEYMNAKGEHKQTILHDAVESSSYETVKLVVKAARGDLMPELKMEPLKEYMNMRKEHVDENYNSSEYPNGRPYQLTPLHIAAKADSVSVKIASLLVDNGAEVDPDEDYSRNIKAKSFDDFEKSPLHYAVNNDRTDMALFLLKKGAFVYRFTFADIVTKGHKEIARAVMNTDQWTVLRSNYKRYVDKDHLIVMTARTNSTTKITTPFRDLIVRMPDIAEAALDQCILQQRKYEEWWRRNKRVLFDYEFIEDHAPSYCGEKWRKYTDQDRLDGGIGHSFEEIESWGEKELSGEKKILPAKWGPRTFCKANHPLQIMIEHKRINLLTHPVVESLIYHKWMKFGMIPYLLNVVTFIFFLALLTATALLIPNPKSPQCASRDVNSTEILVGCPNSTIEPHNQEPIIVASAFGLSVASGRLVYQLIHLVINIGSFIAARRYWNWKSFLVPSLFTEITYWIEVSLYILSIVFIVGIHAVECFCVEDWLWQVGVTAVFLSWIVLMHFVSTFPTIGIYVHILTKIFTTYLRMALMTVLLIISFGLSFHMLFHDPDVERSPFSPVLQSLVTTTTMAAGEVNYGLVFRLDPTGARDGLMGIPYLVFSNLLWIVFLVLIPVTLLNMLTSLAIGDTNETLKDAWLKHLAFQVGHALAMEEFLYILARYTGLWKQYPCCHKIIYPFQEKRGKLFSCSKLWGGNHYEYKDPEVIRKILSKNEVNAQEKIGDVEKDIQEMKAILQSVSLSEVNMQDKIGNMEKKMEEMRSCIKNLAAQLQQNNPNQHQNGTHDQAQ